jgi:hypothetical protein
LEVAFAVTIIAFEDDEFPTMVHFFCRDLSKAAAEQADAINGNLTYDGAVTLEHDAENRLVSATDGSSGAAYAFDGRGRRKLKAVGETSVTISVTDADNREVAAFGRFLQPDPVGYSAGSNLYAYVENDPLNFDDPSGLWTLQVGGSYSLNWGTWSLAIGGGFAVDLKGNAGVYGTISAGPGVGGQTSLGVNAAISNAPRITDLAGWGAGVSVQAGIGAAVGAGWQKGYIGNYAPYQSGNVSLGIGGGMGVSASPSYTKVVPIVTWDAPTPAPAAIGTATLASGALTAGWSPPFPASDTSIRSQPSYSVEPSAGTSSSAYSLPWGVQWPYASPSASFGK